jgi:hypothetical protein
MIFLGQKVLLLLSCIGLALFAILFPIAFYRSSRGIWAGTFTTPAEWRQRH